MLSKTVFILEDEDAQRRSLADLLTRRGFTVAGAGDISTARRLAAEETDAFDVAVLDMRLEPSELTGAEFGIELRRRWVNWPPEFLINSAFAAERYLHLALNLGAAAYLSKTGSLSTIVSYVRSLALRHSLSIQNPLAMGTIRRIVAESRAPSEALYRFCKDFMLPELASCIGMPVLLLFTDGTRTYGLSDQASLIAAHHPTYEAIHILSRAFLAGPPLALDRRWLRSLDPPAEPDLIDRLDGARFIPLLGDQHIGLSLGLLNDRDVKSRVDDMEDLVAVLAKVLSPAISILGQTIVAAWNEASTVRRLGVLTATSEFCLYFGQEQLALMGAAEDAGEIPEEATGYLGQLRVLAEDLRATGETLAEVLPAGLRSSEPTTNGRTTSVSMAALVRESWEAVSQMLDPHQRDILHLEGDCTVAGNRDYLSLAVVRVLQWFAQRASESRPDLGSGISVQCREMHASSETLFEDRSRRVQDTLGRNLFMPFSRTSARSPVTRNLKGPGIHMPLYLAKILIEVGNNGRFADRSGDLEEENGCRLVISFPKDLAPPGID